MTNAFVAALLKMAAEERLKAERERNILFPEPCHGWNLWFNRFGEARIAEYEGRAEVYERFAQRLISEIAGELIGAEFANLNGEAELLERPLPPFEFAPTEWRWSALDWYRYCSPVTPPDVGGFLLRGI